MVTKYINIYAAVFKMRPADMKRYMVAWNKRHPGREDVWITLITPYVQPPGMLFSAPITNPLLSLFDIIAKSNGFTMPPMNEYAPAEKCGQCGLLVTYQKCGRNHPTMCLKCYGDWVDLDLDDQE